MKQLFNIRLFAILWVGLIAVLNCTPIKAQFDEPSRNQWIIDISYGVSGTADPSASYNNYSSNVDIRSISSDDKFSSISASFGVNHRLFNCFYAGIRLGYKYYGNKATGSMYRNYGRGWRYDKSLTTDVSYHNAIIPIEIGYNHTYNHKNGLNIFVSATADYCFSVSTSERYIDTSKPGLCFDASAGLRYFIRHFYIGASYHYGLNDAQKEMGENSIEASIGFRF